MIDDYFFCVLVLKLTELDQDGSSAKRSHLDTALWIPYMVNRAGQWLYIGSTSIY